MANITLPPKSVSLFTTTLAQSIGTGPDETITLTNTARLTQGQPITITIDRVDANSNPTLELREVITGVVSGNNIINYTRGYDETQKQTHSSGAIVEVIQVAADWNKAIDAISEAADSANPENLLSQDTDNQAILGSDEKIFVAYSGSIVIPDDQFFTSTGQRDTFFTEHPEKLVEGVYCSVAEQLQQYKNEEWVDVSAVVRGAKGDKGDKGDIGDKGADGHGIEVLGQYDTLQALQTAHPTGNPGDAYAVGATDEKHIYVWNSDTSSWQDIGLINFDVNAYLKKLQENDNRQTDVVNDEDGKGLTATSTSKVTSAEARLETHMDDDGDDFDENGAGQAPNGAYPGMYVKSADGSKEARLVLTTDGVKQQLPGENFKPVGGAGSGEPPANVEELEAEPISFGASIYWKDPDDTITSEGILAWEGTVVVRKAGSAPESISDGDMVISTRTRNQHRFEPFTDTGLEGGTEYFYRFFPYSTTGAINSDDSQVISVTPAEYSTWGVAIDETNSDPLNALTYFGNAEGMTAGSSDWDNTNAFKNIKPCMVKNGVRQYYLNPNDFTKKEDGTAADITSGADGDVMIEIPKIAYSIVRFENTLYVEITDNPNPPQDFNPTTGEGSDFHFYGHTRNTEGDRDYLYISAYLGYTADGKLRSLSGKTPASNQTIGTFRTQAQANGTGYDLLAFYPLTLIQTMYIVRYKNLDSQAALGQGYVGGSSVQTTGATNNKGMYYGNTSSSTDRVKFMGIEDFWGNIDVFLDGMIIANNSSFHMFTAFENFNENKNGYTDQGQVASTYGGAYIKETLGDTARGFFVKLASGSGSDSTFYADYAALYSDSALRVATLGAGIFAVSNDKINNGGNTSSRLMYL